MIKNIIIFAIFSISIISKPFAKDDVLYVSVASSLYNVSKSLIAEWSKESKVKARIITGPTSLIARQINNGQMSDVIISANEDWLAWMNDRNLIYNKSTTIIAKNSLVFITGINQGLFIDINSDSFSKDLKENLSSSMFPIPHPSTVPLGIYSKQALKSMNLWGLLKEKLVFTSSSRSNLKFISQEEALFGISYFSDVFTSSKVKIISYIDEEKFYYEKPTYWAAKIKRNNDDNDFGFLEWLSSEEAQRIIKSYGFESIK